MKKVTKENFTRWRAGGQPVGWLAKEIVNYAKFAVNFLRISESIQNKNRSRRYGILQP